MVRSAKTGAGRGHTSSASESGVHIADVRRTLGRAWSPLIADKRKRLVDRQATVEDLMSEAKAESSQTHPFGRQMKMVDWLEDIFEAPRRKRIPTTWARWYALADQGRLGYWELRAFAFDWDREGLTTPVDFVLAVKWEISRQESASREKNIWSAPPPEEPGEELDPYGLYTFEEP